MRTKPIPYTREVVTALYRKMRSTKTSVEESRRIAIRLTMARQRLEDKGIDPSKLGFEPRERAKRGMAMNPKPVKAFKGFGCPQRDWFDSWIAPVHGDALERLEALWNGLQQKAA